ncbi:MAG TPA: hypothetical protein VME42_21780 [Steroidobacteraceae bacterium]|nr:hypothetical protein [Steroidobacteraceae bacterium]
MTMFSATASPGHRWKMFLPQAAAIQGDVASMISAVAMARSRWCNGRPHGGARAMPAPQPPSALA